MHILIQQAVGWSMKFCNFKELPGNTKSTDQTLNSKVLNYVNISQKVPLWYNHSGKQFDSFFFFFLMKRFKFTDHTFKPFHPLGIIYPKQMKANVHTQMFIAALSVIAKIQ